MDYNYVYSANVELMLIREVSGRHNPRALLALSLAEEEARQSRSSVIEPEHLLVAVIRERKGLTGAIFFHANFPASEVIDQLRLTFKKQLPSVIAAQLPLSTAAESVLEMASDEADQLHHNFIGVEHLLLALSRIEGNLAAITMTRHGLTHELLQQELVRLSTK